MAQWTPAFPTDQVRGLKALSDVPLPLFAAAETVKEAQEYPLHRHPASFETVALRPPQDEDRLLVAFKNFPHPEEPALRDAACGGSSGQAPASRRTHAADPAKDSETRAAALLPAMPLGEHVVEDYATTGLTIKRHPLAFLRAELAREGLVAAADLATLPVGRRLAIAGLVLIRQRPGSANGVVFVTLEDETGIANLIVWPAILERFRRAALGATLL